MELNCCFKMAAVCFFLLSFSCDPLFCLITAHYSNYLVFLTKRVVNKVIYEINHILNCGYEIK